MSQHYDEIEIEDMTYHPPTTLYTYPCPCGDQFSISLSDLRAGDDVAVCPSCSLTIKVVFDADNLPKVDEDDSGGATTTVAVAPVIVAA